jgi:hypothetical protein
VLRTCSSCEQNATILPHTAPVASDFVPTQHISCFYPHSHKYPFDGLYVLLDPIPQTG